MLLTVALEETVQVDCEIEGEFMLVLHGLTLFFVEISTVYVNEEILGLISDKSCLLLQATVQLHLKVKLLIKSFIKVAKPRINNQSSEVTNDRRLILQVGIIIVLCSSSIEHLFDGSFFGVEDGIVPIFMMVLRFRFNNG